MGKTANWDMSTGTLYASISGVEATVPSESARKKSATIPKDFVGFAMEWSNAAWYFRQPGTERSQRAVNNNVVRVCWPDVFGVFPSRLSQVRIRSFPFSLECGFATEWSNAAGVGPPAPH